MNMTRSRLLPNFIICGAPKAGTSSLHQWIADHPCALGSIEKETYYFVDPGTHMYRSHAHITRGLEGYTRFFPLQPGKNPRIVLESTPAYIYYETALQHIPDLPTRPKCLFVVREPAEQIYSLFTYFQNNWTWIPKQMRFAEYVELIRRGTSPATFKGNELAAYALKYARYIDYLIRWRQRLGVDRMMVCDFTDLKNNELNLVQRIANWLGIDPDFYATYHFPRENETYTVKSNTLQKINVAVRAWLPKGKLYRSLRSVYRRFNTITSRGPNAEDQALINQLKQEFIEPNERLRQEFSLPLRDWS